MIINKLVINATKEIMLINLKLSIPKFFNIISSFFSIKLINKNCVDSKKINGKILFKIVGAMVGARREKSKEIEAFLLLLPPALLSSLILCKPLN